MNEPNPSSETPAFPEMPGRQSRRTRYGLSLLLLTPVVVFAVAFVFASICILLFRDPLGVVASPASMFDQAATMFAGIAVMFLPLVVAGVLLGSAGLFVLIRWLHNRSRKDVSLSREAPVLQSVWWGLIILNGLFAAAIGAASGGALMIYGISSLATSELEREPYFHQTEFRATIDLPNELRLLPATMRLEMDEERPQVRLEGDGFVLIARFPALSPGFFLPNLVGSSGVVTVQTEEGFRMARLFAEVRNIWIESYDKSSGKGRAILVPTYFPVDFFAEAEEERLQDNPVLDKGPDGGFKHPLIQFPVEIWFGEPGQLVTGQLEFRPGKPPIAPAIIITAEGFSFTATFGGEVSLEGSLEALVGKTAKVEFQAHPDLEEPLLAEIKEVTALRLEVFEKSGSMGSGVLLPGDHRFQIILEEGPP